MFGYVNVFKPELKMKDFYKYRAYYCGLCQKLQEKYGYVGKMTLSYDMTFLVLLLSSLYEPKTDVEKKRCMVHPLDKRDMFLNEITEYAADMNIVLTYYKFADDWKDDRDKKAMVGIRMLHPAFRKLEAQYPQKCRKILYYLKSLSKVEKRQEKNIDLAAKYFGRLMAELFAYNEDMWEASLRKMGFFLGKFIYLMDAYDDIEEDMESGSYNVLKSLYESRESDEAFAKSCNSILAMMMAECSAEFEKLPCVENIEILRNILYVGVWNRFDKKEKDSDEEGKGKNNKEKSVKSYKQDKQDK